MAGTVLPIGSPFTTPIGQIIAGGSPPATYDAAWFQGPVGGADALIVSNSDILGVVGPSALAYMKAQGLIFSGTVPVLGLGLVPTAGTGGTVATLNVSGSTGTPTGQVQWLINATPYTTTTLVAGQSVLSIPSPAFATGPNTVEAIYLGDRLYLEGSTSQVYNLQVAPIFDTFLINGVASPGSFPESTPCTFVTTWDFLGPAPTAQVTYYKVNLAGPPIPVQTVSLVHTVGTTYTATTTGLVMGTSPLPGLSGNGLFFATFLGDADYEPLDSSTYSLTNSSGA